MGLLYNSGYVSPRDFDSFSTDGPSTASNTGVTVQGTTQVFCTEDAEYDMNRGNIAGLLFAIAGVIGLVHFVVAQGTLLSNAFTGLTGVSFLSSGRLIWLRDD